MPVWLIGIGAFLKTIPWYAYGMFLCFLLGGCACQEWHKHAPHWLPKPLQVNSIEAAQQP